MKKLLFTLILSLLSSTAISETVTTGNLLTNSTFGTGTTYSTTGWTVDEHTHGHPGTGSFGTLGGGHQNYHLIFGFGINTIILLHLNKQSQTVLVM